VFRSPDHPFTEGEIVTLVRGMDLTSDLVFSLSKLAVAGDQVASIAHQFNNALTVVLGQAELLTAWVSPVSGEAAQIENVRAQGKASGTKNPPVDQGPGA